MKISDITIKSSKLKKFLYWADPFGYLRHYKVSKALSKKINELLDDPNTELIIQCEYMICLGGLTLWVGNYPYAYGNYHKPYQIEDAVNELIYSEPLTERWETLVNFLNQEDEYEKAYGDRVPDRVTVFRLRQVEESAKLFVYDAEL
jgi:hypothetical protein